MKINYEKTANAFANSKIIRIQTILINHFADEQHYEQWSQNNLKNATEELEKLFEELLAEQRKVGESKRLKRLLPSQDYKNPAGK